MAGYLLDTNIALLALAQPSRLSRRIRSAVERGPNFLSVVSFWEVLLKGSRGKLDVGEPRSWWSDALRFLAATPLQLRPDHIGALCELRPIHHDPFDRVLIAQATVESFALVTTDGEIRKYVSERFRVVS